MTHAQVWITPYKACHHTPLGSIVYRSHWTLDFQRYRWDENWLYMPDYDRLNFMLVWNSLITGIHRCGHIHGYKEQHGTKTCKPTKLPYFDKSSAMISNLVNKTWFSCYPCCQCMPTSVRSTSECYTGASASGNYHNALHCWTRHGQYSRNQWHWCIPDRCSMGHLLNLPHSTQSLPRSSNFWSGRDVWDSLPCWPEQNWGPQAMPDRP
jgi:hypothetical protein